MKVALDDVVEVCGHVVAEVVKAEFVVRSVDDVASVCGFFVGAGLSVVNCADCETEEFVESSHPLCITSCEVIVDCYYENAFFCEGVEVSRECTNECFPFTGFHFGDVAVVENDSTE